mgnify:CR=1 FL=1
MIRASPKSQILTINPCPLMSTFAGLRSLCTTLAECRYLSLSKGGVPAEQLIEDQSHIFNLEEDIVALEHLLQIAVTELSDQIDLVEVVNALPLGHQHLYHPHDVRMPAILQQHDFTQNPSRLRQGLEEVYYLLYRHITPVRTTGRLRHVPERPLADHLAHLVTPLEVIRRKNLVDKVSYRLTLHHSLAISLHCKYNTTAPPYHTQTSPKLNPLET